MTRVLIEVSGGLVTNIMVDGEVMVNVIDHDSLDPEDLPEDLSEEVEIDAVREFQSPDEIRTPDALDAYIEDIIDRYRTRENP
ncbi:MAG: hypothetical protein M0Z67_02625 [Nitrospiraceae bacterium]|nr:hypothetical protein [Nitrospiraceae bacterium]